MTAPSLAYQDAMNGIAILYDALSNAENELDKLKNAWIKCSERMPELDDDGYSYPVLLFGKRNHVESYKQFVGYLDSNGVFYFDAEFDCVPCHIVKYWMPLPKLPKD